MLGNIKLKKDSLTASQSALRKKQFPTVAKGGEKSQFNTISKKHSKNALKKRKERMIIQMDSHNAFFPLSLSIHQREEKERETNYIYHLFILLTHTHYFIHTLIKISNDLSSTLA
jgi:hypothetical protein